MLTEIKQKGKCIRGREENCWTDTLSKQEEMGFNAQMGQHTSDGHGKSLPTVTDGKAEIWATSRNQ